MPASFPSELLEQWRQCRTRRWRLPVWAQGDQSFLRSCWHLVLTQLQPDHHVFWLGDIWPDMAALPNIHHINGQARQQLLGQECDVLLIQATHGMDWDLVAASMGCLKAGGLWLILTADQHSFIRQPNPAARKLLSYPAKAEAHIGYFQRWLTSRWQQQTLLHWTPAGISGALPGPAATKGTADIPAPYASVCQQTAVQAIFKVAHGHRHRPLVLSAHRGRGKSAAIGIAAAHLLQAGKTRLIITAPQPAAAQVALSTCVQQLAPQSADGLQFWSLDRLLAELPAADLLFIDEAAAIPAPQLQALVQRYSRIVFATTEHGYEGTGRGFQLRFQQYLQQHRPGWRKQVLQQPIRYGEHDPLEQVIFDSFLLTEPAFTTSVHESAPLQYHSYQAAELAANPNLLQQIFRLASLAHYQTSIRDLWALLDDPMIRVVTVQQSDLVLAVAVIGQEGQLPADLVPHIYQGSRRVQGHLSAQSLIYHCLTPETGTLAIWRIQRLMVQPELQLQGIGSQLLTYIEQLAQQHQIALMSTSFGATLALVKFWQKAGYLTVKLSQQLEQSSNEFSALLIKGVRDHLPFELSALTQRFGESLYVQAEAVWSALDPRLLQLWACPPQQPWTALHQQELMLFVSGLRDWQQSFATLKRWLDLNYQRLTESEASVFVEACWQGKTQAFNNNELKNLTQQLRQMLALTDLHQVQQD